MFTVIERTLSGFECEFNGVRYRVVTTKGLSGHVTTNVWTWDADLDGYAFGVSVPDVTMRHIALELYTVYDILLDGYEFLSPSARARKRAVDAAMKSYVEARA